MGMKEDKAKVEERQLTYNQGRQKEKRKEMQNRWSLKK